MAATSQPLASAVAVEALRAGGNAFDAAIAAAAVLNVVEPTSTGIGGDMFVLGWSAKEQRAFGLNGSGRAPASLTIERLRAAGHTEMPRYGPFSVTVPGTVEGWGALSSRYGKLPWKELLAPAIRVATDGFSLTPRIAAGWQATFRKRATEWTDWVAVYAPGGHAPDAGERVMAPALAKTLTRIAEEGPREFYEGETARTLAAYCASRGSPVNASDLREHRSTWVDPISIEYGGVTILELPPNGQGITALQMLRLLQGYDLSRLAHNSAEYLHLLIETKKLAFADRDAYVADPEHAAVPVEELLSETYAARRRLLINPLRAGPEAPAPGLTPPTPTSPPSGDTVYLATADAEGNCCSFINSLYEGFGSGLVSPDLGVALQNRGALFRLDPTHPNALAPRKRPFHTIIPAMALRDGRPWQVFGVMGGDMQPQGHVQVLLNRLHFGMDAQQAGAAPRFQHFQGVGTALESGISTEVARALTATGHTLIPSDGVQFGGYQAIEIAADGSFLGGSDPRKDGCALGL